MLGRLSAGLAHDLKNMLAVLLPNLDYLRKLSHTEPLDRAEMAECIEDIEYAANQGAELMPRFGTIARSSDEGAVQVDVSTICDQVVQLARRTFSRAVEVSAAIDPDLCVNGNSADLFQILMNLCLNARDAMPDGGKLELSAKTCEESGSGRAGNRIRMTVRDSGEGMDEATLARAFEPFFTTKARAQGFGVGLATVRDLVGQLGGEIRARSELGVGTTFEVDLPLVPAKAALRRDTADGRVTSPPPSAEDALVLLVDDEPAVRRVMRKQLELRGYTVIEAEDGQHALEVHASCSPQPDVVVLDLDMPRLPGHEVVRELKRASPQVQVLIHTAIPKSEAAHDALHYGALQCLSKPCDPQALLTAISRALRR